MDALFSELIRDPEITRDEKRTLVDRFFEIRREQVRILNECEAQLTAKLAHVLPLIGGATRIRIPVSLFTECCELLMRRRLPLTSKDAAKTCALSPLCAFSLVDSTNGNAVPVAFDPRLTGQQWALEK